ncbi:DUF3106 domain-containing protein [Silanimonas sp.]|uniref:DUF3106 domain-containing protein n=1 Tax=Silanimonas sp. TaxID=1929290 RepID=UPI0022BC1B53|nr:DUF3106 domain-containing protein [Silanimonas sp.]MCZ8115148.1 DUF3106 domain-containing protein [Silanimonas sp.]
MSSTPSSALPAFLRGIEPRARVLSRAQAGPALDDERLLADVREEFSARAARLPLAEWPLRYWGLLLARDELGRPSGQTPAHPLYSLTHTRRLALLLRLVVGLEPAGAARVMGLSETAYRALWADAEDKLAEQGVGPAVLMRWHEAFQREARGEGVAGDAPRTPTRHAAPVGRARASRWRPTPLQWGLGAMALVLLAVLAATFIWPPAPLAPSTAAASADDAAPATLEASPGSPPRDMAAELVVDPDFALLDAAPTAPWREGVAFLSWATVQRGTALPTPAAPAPLAVRPWGTLPSDRQALLAPVEAAWPALDAASQAALLGNAEAWSGYDTARREALRTAYAAWVERPALERSALRGAYAEWMALDAGEREALAATAAALAALPAEGQKAQRAAFAALDAEAQRDWAVGPRLGAQLPGLRPLLAFVPAGEQAALIAALEALGDPARAALAARVAAMGTAERAALRGKVLAAPAEARPALLAEAATP